MPNARVHSPAVWIKAADDHVVEADECSEHAHRGDQPKRCVTGDRKSQANHISFASAPIAVKDRSRALPIDIARSLDVCWYQLIRLKRDRLARRDASLQEPDFTTSPVL